MKVLIIGSGGREHVLAWKLSRSPSVTEIYCAPGNGGTASLACNVNLKPDDVQGLLSFASGKKIDLTVVGPEVPLVAGITDLFRENGLRIFGPSKDGARLEGSKSFAKEIMKSEGVPTAEYEEFTDKDRALEYLKNASYPLVIKADGLAAGKGVVICMARDEAVSAVKEIMIDRKFSSAGERIVIEEYLIGEEVSIIALTDGDKIIPLASSQDHKAVFDNDKGPNTGGMGAYSPAPIATEELFSSAIKGIIEPVIKGLKKKGIKYTGTLYAGLMVTKDGPKVLEFNVRFGDPEAQVIIPRIKDDLFPVLYEIAGGKITTSELEYDGRACVGVVMCSGGYPGAYDKGKKITGLKDLDGVEGIEVFHAGTDLREGDFFTSGGRVLNVVALADGIESAIEKVYSAVSMIDFEGKHFRKDIGAKAKRHFS